MYKSLAQSLPTPTHALRWLTPTHLPKTTIHSRSVRAFSLKVSSLDGDNRTPSDVCKLRHGDSQLVLASVTPPFSASAASAAASVSARGQRRRVQGLPAPVMPQRALHASAALRGRPGFVRRGDVSPPRTVPAGIELPPYVRGLPIPPVSEEIDSVVADARIWTEEELIRIRRACKLARQALDFVSSLVQPGVTTDFLDAMAHDFIVAARAYPSTLHYQNFPKSICTSVNNVLCHGIPDSRPLEAGDIVNLDVTVYYQGMHGDCSQTLCVGGDALVDDTARHLVAVTKEALYRAIRECGPGREFRKIGNTIEEFVRSHGFKVMEDFCGHGVGADFHTAPYVLHCANDMSGLMEQGMVFTIEPLVAERADVYTLWDDEWTQAAMSAWSAQFEHTVEITGSGVKILTA